MLDELQERGCYQLNEVLKRESKVENSYSVNKVLGLGLGVDITQA
jgi:hypothetical protein